MTINELIIKLREIQSVQGNILVEVRNDAGEFNDLEVVDTTFYRVPEQRRKWVVFLDV